MLGATDRDDDNPFLASDDDEDEFEENEVTVYCTERHVSDVFGQGLSNCIAQRKCTRPRLVITHAQCLKLIVVTYTNGGNTVLGLQKESEASPAACWAKVSLLVQYLPTAILVCMVPLQLPSLAFNLLCWKRIQCCI